MIRYRSTDARDQLSEVVLDIAHQRQPADMIKRIAQLAAKLIECAAADLIRVTDNGKLVITASSDPQVSDLTRAAWRQWPHFPITEFPAAGGTAPMVELSTYRRQLGNDTGIVQELFVPLVAGRTDHGYLRFLFSEPFVGHANRALIAAFAAHAAIALDRAALLVQVTSLQLALTSNRTIAAAIGVLMARHSLTYSDGLDQLKVASQDANRRLHDVAGDVLHTGQMPAAQIRRRHRGSAA